MRLDGKRNAQPSCLVVDLSAIESQIATLQKKVVALQTQLVDLASVLSSMATEKKPTEKAPGVKGSRRRKR